MKGDEYGWWDAPVAKNWLCPKCNKISPVERWREVGPSCDECGSHDGRKCPECWEWFDHVWGSKEIKSGDQE